MADLRDLAEAVELLAERRRQDGLRLACHDWLEETQSGLFAHQRAFESSPKDEAWLFGANRSGKSEALADVGACFGRFGVLDVRAAYTPGFLFGPAKKIWVTSLTNDMSRNIMQPKLFNNGARLDPRPSRIPDSEIASWNITNQTLILKNGTIFFFKSGEQGRDAFMGADVDLHLFDEVPDEDVYKECTIRLGGGRKLLIRGAATILPPVGVSGGVAWMFKAKAQPWLALGATVIERNAKSPHIDIFTAGIRDNKTIRPDQIDKLASTFAPGSPEYLIRIEGALLPSIGGALCYGSFSREFHVVNSLAPLVGDRRIPQIIPQLPLCLSIDFNPENGVWTVGQRVGKIFRVLDEITLERSDIASMAHEFRMRYPAHQAELWIYGDATGLRLEGQTGMASFHLVHHYLSGYPVPIRFQLPTHNPLERHRVEAVNLQLRPPSGERLVEFSPLCTETIADAEGSKWNARYKIDKRHGRRSDGMDCVGYWIMQEAPPRAAFQTSAILRSIKTPRYLNAPSARSAAPVRIGDKWYGRRLHG